MRTSPACNFQDKRKSDRPTTGQKAGYAPDRSTLLSATPSFQIGKNFENRQKHQRRRSARVGQADFGKLELNNRNHSGNCQRLFNLQFIAAEVSDLRAFVDGRGYYYPSPF